jgi:hypothetical protein
LKPELQWGASKARERRGLAAGNPGYGATFILSQETAFGAVHANLAATRIGYELPSSREENRRMRYRLSVAPVFELDSDWKVALDAGVLTNPDRSRRARTGYVEVGVIWAPHEDLELALGWIRHVADGEARQQRATAAITWRFR